MIKTSRGRVAIAAVALATALVARASAAGATVNQAPLSSATTHQSQTNQTQPDCHCHPRHHQREIAVTAHNGRVHFSSTRLRAGRTTFNLVSPDGEAQVSMFRLKPGATLDDVTTDLSEMFGSDPAAGTRHTVRDATLVGLGTATSRHTLVTERLTPGTYYAFDVDSMMEGGAPQFTKVTVCAHSGVRAHRHLWPSARVAMTSQDTFEVHGSMPARGTIRVANPSDTLHFVEIAPVVPGTTDEEVQAWLESGSEDQPPFLLNGPEVSTQPTSPGVSIDYSYRLPAGTYVLLCWIPDDVTGMPHAVMGMHKVVELH